MTVSLVNTPGFVKAVHAQFFAPLTPFDPEDVDLDVYGFLSWVRTGIASAITDARAGNRATVDVAVTIGADTGETREVVKSLTLYGPGDVLGIDPNQIIRREPAAGPAMGDASTLAHIEFDQPELPWLYTPLPANGERLKPWIALIVCDASLARLEQGAGGLPARITVPISELQPLDDSWAWAHAQVHGGLNEGPNLSDRLTDDYAPQNLSRLLCPRHLEDERDYIACVVPTFECGRLAGLGQSTEGLAENDGEPAPAWSGTDGEVTLPVYDFWHFSTTVSANFEMLARKLIPVPAPHEVGRRVIDLSAPRGGMADDVGGVGSVQSIDCPLHSPAPAAVAPAEWDGTRVEQLRTILNAPGKAANEAAGKTPDLPRIGPRIYASHQRGRSTVATLGAGEDWFTALNLRPTDRIAAGLGTRVVKKDQEEMVQAAWAQIGEVEKANRELDRIRFARFISEAMIAKTLAKVTLGPLTQMVRPVYGKIGLTDGQTAAGMIRASALPPAATSSAFRRLTAANGKIARTAEMLTFGTVQATTKSAFSTMITQTNGLADMRRTYNEPDAIGGMSAGALATLPIGRLAQLLNVTPDLALAKAVERLGGFTPVADSLTKPREQWTLRTETIDIGKALVTQRLEKLETLAASVDTLSPARREALGAAMSALVPLATDDVAHRLETRIMALDAIVPSGLTVRRTDGDAPRPVGPVVFPSRRPTIPTRGGTVFRRGEVLAPLERKTLAKAAIERFGRFGGGVRIDPQRGMTAIRFADALAGMVSGVGIGKAPKTPNRSAPVLSREALLAPLAPARTARLNMLARLGTLPEWLPPSWFDNGLLTPIMAAPHFDRPMYEALETYDKDWLIANLGKIKEQDFVTLLVSNPRFIEAYMIGLSDEMGRELLWRGYPTDQRGTYFHHFWDPVKPELKTDIHRFAATALGSHFGADNGQEGKEQIVMLVKGDLIRRFPNAIFLATRGTGEPSDVLFEDPPAPGETGSVSFMAPLGEDALLVGLQLTQADIEAGGANPRWWFMIAEHPSAPRFGLDVKPQGAAPDTPTTVNDLDWQDLPTTQGGRFLHAVPGPTVSADGNAFTWGSNAATVARMLLQNPARAAFDARALVNHAK